MLSIDRKRWLVRANRSTIVFDWLDNKFGQTRVDVALVTTLVVALATELTIGIATDHSESPPIVLVVIMCVLALVSIAAIILALFAERGAVVEWYDVANHYGLSLLLSPAIVADRKTLRQFREAIGEYAEDNILSVQETIEAGIDPARRESARAQRSRIQGEAAQMAAQMGYPSEAFGDHMLSVDNAVCAQEATMLRNRLIDLRRSYAQPHDDIVATYLREQIQGLEGLSLRYNL